MKPKSTATVTPKSNQQKPSPPNKTKSAQKSTNKSAIATSTTKTSKPVKSTSVTAAAAAKIEANKKKSIFSPENSSEESDSAVNMKQNAIKTQLKSCGQKPRPKAAARPVVTALKNEKSTGKVEKVQTKSKVIVSSASSASSSTETTSSSDSDSSAESVKKNVKKPMKKPMVKEQGSDSEVENQKEKQVWCYNIFFAILLKKIFVEQFTQFLNCVFILFLHCIV